MRVEALESVACVFDYRLDKICVFWGAGLDAGAVVAGVDFYVDADGGRGDLGVDGFEGGDVVD